MAELRQNTWTTDSWYGQYVAGTTGGYRWGGKAYSWGSNANGKMGQNAPGPSGTRSSPLQIGTTTDFKTVGGSGNLNTVAVIKSDGTLWTWGNGGNGVLATNEEKSYSSPIQVGTDTTWTGVVQGGANQLGGIKTDGTLWMWGNNQLGVLGLSEAAPAAKSSPTQLPGTDWKQIDIGVNKTAIAVKTDGTLWCWGNADHGSVGNNSTNVDQSSPTQVGSGTDWDKVAAGYYTVGAVKTNGTLWCWGDGNHGTCGDNETGGESSPKQVPGTTWSDLDMGNSEADNRSVMAIKTNGTLWTWGSGRNGQLGPEIPGGPNAYRSSPIQVPGTWNVTGDPDGSKTFSMNYSVAAKKSDGTYWTWGRNYYGQLGHNIAYKYPGGAPIYYGISSPKQLPGTWTRISTGGNVMVGVQE